MFLDIRSKLIHAVTHWPVIEGEYGSREYGPPTLVEGRWRDISELFVNSLGKEEVSKAQVTIEDAREIKVGDYLYFGESAVADPRNQVDAHAIKQYKRVADLRGNVYLKTVIL